MNAPAIQYNQSDPIAVYLARLGAAAYGLDAALVHDMLADAEDHLRSAVRQGVDPLQAVQDFGSPDDVVSAYVSADRRRRSVLQSWGQAVPSSGAVSGGAGGGGATTGFGGGGGVHPPVDSVARQRKPLPAPYTLPEPAPAPRSRLIGVPIVGVWFDRYAWGSLALFIIGLAPSILYFTLMVGGVALAIGLIPSLIGIPLLILVLGMARILSLWHGVMIESLTGVRMPRRFAPIPATGAESLWGRLKVWLTDGRSWLSAFYLIGNLPVAVLLFSLFVTLGTLSVALAVLPVANLATGGGVWAEHNVQFDLGVGALRWDDANPPPPAVMLVFFAAGLLLSTATLYLARGTGWLYAQAAKAIQVSRPNPIPV